MKVDELRDLIADKALSLGERDRSNYDRKLNAVKRINLADRHNSPYIGFIRIEEEQSGLYSDFSLVIFPEIDQNNDVKSFAVSLTVGSQGFKNDYELALQPGWRRQFLKLTSDKTFFKTDFSDTTTILEPLFSSAFISDDLKDSLKKYERDILAIEVFDVPIENNKLDEATDEKVNAWFATYANLRGWASTVAQKNKVSLCLPKAEKYDENVELNDIRALLGKHRYVVLQGAPGCGKTFTASRIANDWEKKNGANSVFFTQFHAETTYADFIWGIEPNYAYADGECDTRSVSMSFREKKGILLQAIEAAKKDTNKDVLLIIDEINRANLPNVLGPVFYLFEKGAVNRHMKLQLGSNGGDGDNEYSTLPDNLYVLATMNTADRSLAVVDFALRRRFIWYTMRPHVIDTPAFQNEAFHAMERIFMQHAKDEELTLMPGQSYFLEDNGITFEERAKYELLPLIKEYLAEGRLTTAKDEFSKYFATYAKQNLFE